jgi:N-acetylmuramoyl-L-alanine amidase
MRTKTILTYFSIFSLFIFASAFVSDAGVSFLKPKKSKRKAGIKTIVIDAGHGGKDPGCAGNPKSESKITLALALKIGKYIEENLPDVKVIYTRKTDVFIELYERANIANRNNADLFMSIHCNSLPTGAGKKAHGTEVYVMGLHTADENLEIAKKVAERENQTIVMETDYKKNYGGYDPKDPATHILLSMAQNVHLDQSIHIADLIHKECKSAGQHSRGVHQAGFVVIRATAMPSILVESGYLTNEGDNAFLQSQKGQNTLAKSIYRAVKSFKYELEGKKKADEPLDEPDTEPNGNGQDGENYEPPQGHGQQEPQSENSSTQETENRAENPKKPQTKLETKRKTQQANGQQANPQNANPQTGTRTIDSATTGQYYVQLLSNDKALPENSPVFRGVTDIWLEIADKRYRYLTGPYPDWAAASAATKALQQKGFKGAYVVKR